MKLFSFGSKDIGIDLESGEPIKEALKYYDKKILELEKLI